MKLTGNAVFLSKEAKSGYKDPSKTYYNALFMAGTETVTASVDKDVFFESLEHIPQFSECNVTFDYNAKYGMLTLVGIDCV